MYSADSFVADEIPTTAKWNKLWSNDASFNDGTGIASGAITPNKLGLVPASSQVATSETTTSSSFTDLATSQSVSITVGANGLALVGIGAFMQCSLVSGNSVSMSFVATGANAITVGTSPYTLLYQTWTANAFGTIGRSWLIAGLNPGVTTFTAKFKTTAGTGIFADRNIYAIPL